MKIYFSGSHAVGKSTCARYVSEKYNLQLITEVARMVLSEQELQIDTLRYDIDLVDKYQKQIFDRQISEENKYTDFVSDRSVIDSLAYAASHSRILPNLLASTQLQSYLESLKKDNVILFFVRPTKATLRADGVREIINWDEIISIDAQIKLLLEMWGLKYFQINMDNMQERIRLIDNIISINA